MLRQFAPVTSARQSFLATTGVKTGLGRGGCARGKAVIRPWTSY